MGLFGDILDVALEIGSVGVDVVEVVAEPVLEVTKEVLSEIKEVIK